jgi:hypothetical protein
MYEQIYFIFIYSLNIIDCNNYSTSELSHDIIRIVNGSFPTPKVIKNKEEFCMNLLNQLLDKKKKATENNNKSFLKTAKGKPNNTSHQMPMRKTGRGK